MPRSVATAANRNARTARVADARAPREFSLAEAELATDDDFEVRREVNVMVRKAIRSGRYHPNGRRYVSANGLATMVEKAMAEYVEAVGHDSFPHNFVRSQTSSSVGKVGPYGRLLPKEEADAEVERYARLAGWIKAAKKLPAVRKVLLKGMWKGGMNSPYTYFTPWDLSRRFPSPGRLERLLWATKKRAQAVLSAYKGGLKPSWVNITFALLNDARSGKAGIIAAAAQLGFCISDRQVGAYRAAREWLVTHRSAAFPVADATDGVAVRLAATPELEKLGVTVTLGLRVGGVGNLWEIGKRDFIRLVRKGERTFHSTWRGPVEAMHEAIRAWKKQDQLIVSMRQENPDLVAFLEGDETGSCPLVYRDASYAAGNCSPGTEQWVREKGWANREFIPGVWLIPCLSDWRVKNVAMQLMAQDDRMAA